MKSKWKSKTWWASLITGAAGVVGLFYPPVGVFVTEQSEQILVALGLVFSLLRINTTGPVS